MTEMFAAGLAVAATALGWICAWRLRLERFRARDLPWWFELVTAALTFVSVPVMALTVRALVLPDTAIYIWTSSILAALGGFLTGTLLWQARSGFVLRNAREADERGRRR
ncbi:MAG: hypothetical protein ACRCY8_05540 [Dermatophilaceae bacterium]